jgi:hypothetical protein
LRQRWVDNGVELEKLKGQPKQLRESISQVLADKPRSGSPGLFTSEQVCHLLAVACETPPEHLSHWSRPELARAVISWGNVRRMSVTSVGRFLKSGRFKAASGQILVEPQS